MRNIKIKKILLFALAVVIVGIFIYLMILFTVWAIAFAVTILTIIVLILAISKTREWLREKRQNSRVENKEEIRARDEVRTYRKY